MGRSPCCDKVGLKKGPWTPEEDQKLLAYIEEHGHGSWRALPAKAGLQRCGKSCRLRWTNYLRPDIKRGKFSLQEEQTIIQLHALLGNRWSAIATHLPKRTDNEIKNYWNTHLKKRLTKMGIDPVTHKPKSDALGSGQSKDAANLSHMAQWESARLEAEARLGRDSKPALVSNPYQSQLGLSSSSSSAAQLLNKAATAPPPPPKMPPCLDVLKAWQGAWTKPMKDTTFSNSFFTSNGTLASPTSILNFSENIFNIPPVGFVGNPSIGGINYAENPGSGSGLGAHGDVFTKNDVENDWKYLGNNSKGAHGDMYTKNDVENDWKFLGNQSNFLEVKATMQQIHDMPYPIDGTYIADTLRLPSLMESFTDHHLPSFNSTSGQVDNGDGSCGGDNFEENKNYWNNILNLVTLQSGSSVF